ncbi:hypothetical protein BHM03_00007737 [Ensete ventricosum]|nr:hypothetical protein BHM03_00007737 [Ensete ventricosum]
MPVRTGMASGDPWILVVRYISKPRFAISTCTARYGRYILVRQVTGTQTARYRAVPSKINCQRSISTIDSRLKKKSTDKLFLDREGGGYYNTPGEDPSVLLRIKEDHDGAEPSGNSVAAINLIRLSSIISGARSEDYRRTAEHLLYTDATVVIMLPIILYVQAVFETRLKDQGIALPLMCCAANMLAVPSRKQVVLVGDKASADFVDMVAAVFASYDPNRTVKSSFLHLLHAGAYIPQKWQVIQIDRSSREEMELWENCNPNVAQMAKGTVEDKKAVAYVCQDFVCSPPVTEPDALRALLGKAVAVASST